uniref:V-type proton ATPase subunit a n=1 Tax=Strombidium rassoulzadegani TaxID=1082188 RepID=A0A7S3FSH2_9SPIT|mmetsp:Transcript_13732/g.23418  ORF Transcript_13732/g.23418 Transcript_13732/m.23418 type:complete len:545 (+) Transcript_13732:1132-2766(+)
MAYENHSIQRPTYFKITDFTYVFQLIVDTYGVPTYLEANPALISIVTFPFFFGMMFGDMGHGSIVLMFGLFLTLFNDRLKGSALQMLLPFRYLVLLMGIMATYAGFIYNEFFAIPTNIFDSCYSLKDREQWNPSEEEGKIVGTFVYLRKSIDCNYPAGQDPVWGLTSNRLTFVNGVKMKMSVIFAIVHMSIGIVIKGTNTIYNSQYLEFFTEVCVGLFILLGLFGWMDLLIIAKWFKEFDLEDTSPAVQSKRYFNTDSEVDVNQAPDIAGDENNRKMPSIINILINTVFGFGAHDAETEAGTYPLIGSSLDQQYGIAVALLVIVVIFIPIMLLTKPCLRGSSGGDDDEHDEIEFTDINRAEQEMQQNLLQPRIQQDSIGSKEEDQKTVTEQMMLKREYEMKSLQKQLRDMGTKEHSHSFGELFIHQMIETIEFVLGTVSNTASYLRLWALSLAHGQLAETFLDLTFAMTFGAKNLGTTVVLGFFLWPAFWSITFGVLIMMDQLECFLHTLRLHWVEFQNKFFKGEGYAFKPYSYEATLGSVLEE